jgi:hypothetical protein
MAKATHNTDVDPKELERAQAAWAGFTALMTRSVISVVAILVLMAWFLL